MFLSFGNAFTFGGLLAILPGKETFDSFERKRNKVEAEKEVKYRNDG